MCLLASGSGPVFQGAPADVLAKLAVVNPNSQIASRIISSASALSPTKTCVPRGVVDMILAIDRWERLCGILNDCERGSHRWSS